MLLSALMAATGQLCWKLSNAIDIRLLLLGFLLYGIGAVLMITAYRYGSLSVLHPMQSTTYILSTILAFLVLKEPIESTQLGGISLIILGVMLIGGGDD